MENFELQVVDLVESYNFHIKFSSIRFKKNHKFLKRDRTPTVVAHDGRRCFSTVCLPTAVGHGGRSLPPSLTTFIILQFFADHIFLQN
jgi:hypothetical protein